MSAATELYEQLWLQALLFQELDALVAEFEFPYFAAAGEGEAVDEKYVLGDFMTGYLAAAVVSNFIVGHFNSVVEDDEGADFFAVFFGGDADDLNVFYAVFFIEEVFYFAGIDVFASADNHVLDAAGDAVVAVGVLDAEVAAVEPAVGVDDFGCLDGAFVISFHDEVAAAAHFALLAVGTFFAGFGIDDFNFGEGIFVAYGGASGLEAVGEGGVCHAGRAFGEAIDACDICDVHPLGYCSHDFFGAERAGHDAGAEGGEVEHVEHGVVQLGDKHGGDAV